MMPLVNKRPLIGPKQIFNFGCLHIRIWSVALISELPNVPLYTITRR